MTDFSKPPAPSPPPPAKGFQIGQFWLGMLLFLASQVVWVALAIVYGQIWPSGPQGQSDVALGTAYAAVLIAPIAITAATKRWSMLAGFFALPIMGLLLYGGCMLVGMGPY